MSEEDRGEVNRLLFEAAEGKKEAVDEHFKVVDEELHRLTHQKMLDERSDHTWGLILLL